MIQLFEGRQQERERGDKKRKNQSEWINEWMEMQLLSYRMLGPTDWFSQNGEKQWIN